MGLPFKRTSGMSYIACSRKNIGPLDTYWEIFDSTAKEEPVQGSLAGDISDICFDLKRSLELEESDVPKSDLQFDWRFDFRSHWARHLLGALTAIHHRHIK